MKKITLIAIAAFFSLTANAQEKEKFYGRMLLTHAKELVKDAPEGEVEIIDQKGNEAVVYMTLDASERLHERILTHGPGYFYEGINKQIAINNLRNKETNVHANKVYNFSITEDALVNKALNEVKVKNIEDHIQELEAYGTRYHETKEGKQAADDLKAKWEAMAKAKNRDDITVEFFQHSDFATKMPSIILTIKGTETPDEIVVIGGHLDSTVQRGSKNEAPGADDDASGIATITEALRTLIAIGFKPKRTIQFMAYSAEEVGLLGSKEIVEKYVADKKNVLSALQMDMTNVKASSKDIYFMTGNSKGPVSKELNDFLKKLLEHYHGSGDRKIEYGETTCGYGCSDHANWSLNGFKAAFPFESDFKDLNYDRIHTKNDNFAASDNNANHALNFCYLSVDYLIEMAKGEALSVDEFSQDGYTITFSRKAMRYKVNTTMPSIQNVIVYNVEGKQVKTINVTKRSGKESLKGLSSGTYIANFRLANNKSFSKKFILN